MKIAHATEGFVLDVELHGPGPVHRHIMSGIRNTNFFELGLVHPNVKSTKARYISITMMILTGLIKMEMFMRRTVQA